MIYNIRKHRSKHGIQLVNFKRFKQRTFGVTFLQGDHVDKNGVNKLIGFSNVIHTEKIFGKIPIIKNLVNSILIGWRQSQDGTINFFDYGDNKGVEHRDRLLNISVKEMEPFYVTFSVDPSKKYLKVSIRKGDTTVVLRPMKLVWPFFGYKLYPYFGGTEKATRLIKIMIWEQ